MTLKYGLILRLTAETVLTATPSGDRASMRAVCAASGPMLDMFRNACRICPSCMPL